MGLDIYHIQLSLTPDSNGYFFYIEDLDLGCNVPLKEYSKYITTIDDIAYNKSIAIVRDENHFEKLKQKEWFSEENYLKVFIGEHDATMRAQLSRYIVNQKLDKLKTAHSSWGIESMKYHIISFGEPTKVQGVYYTDNIGYQRKGMSDLFSETFSKYMLWGKKEDFEFAYTCIGGDWYLEHFGEKVVNEMRINFKKNFIDKFEFGKSLLDVSF